MKKEGSSVRHKRGVSELLSYTLLIVIAIGASVLVYKFLVPLIPHQQVECKPETSLIIKEISCSSDELKLTLQNKGLFSVDSAFVRVGTPEKDTRTQINSYQSGSFYFNEGLKLKPNQEQTWSFARSSILSAVPQAGDYIVEIQPAMWDDDKKKSALCPSVITQNINCPP